jgi:deoxyribose-phosphate aldolase
LILVRDLGASRCGVSATAAILDEYRRREAAERAGQFTASDKASPGGGDY